MTRKMAVVFIKHTGHVLAAFTRTADPDGTTDLAAVVGPGLILHNPRSGGAAVERLRFVLPADVLQTKVVPIEAGIFANPHTFVVDGDQVARLGTVPPFVTIKNLTRTEVELSYPGGGNAPADHKVWATIAGREPTASERRIVAGKIDSGRRNVTLRLTLLPDETDAAISIGNYGVVVAAAGCALAFEARSVP